MSGWAAHDVLPSSQERSKTCSRLYRAPEVGKSLNDRVRISGIRQEIIGQPPRQRAQIVLRYVQDAGELPVQMPGAGTTPIMLDVIQLLRRNRPSILLLHDAGGELLLAQPLRLACLRDRLGEGPTFGRRRNFIAQSPCQSDCSRICENAH